WRNVSPYGRSRSFARRCSWYRLRSLRGPSAAIGLVLALRRCCHRIGLGAPLPRSALAVLGYRSRRPRSVVAPISVLVLLVGCSGHLPPRSASPAGGGGVRPRFAAEGSAPDPWKKRSAGPGQLGRDVYAR